RESHSLPTRRPSDLFDFGYRVERGEAVVEQRRMHEIAACAAVYRPHLGAQPVGVQFGDRSVKTCERLRPAPAVEVYQPDRKLFGDRKSTRLNSSHVS